ncbi:MAG: hypothetical protein COB16_01390 [Rhodobacteraceae bacterium]|nr:MAG: hypothetical protein COB16_01390 [Paracoccaceae bacterium]
MALHDRQSMWTRQGCILAPEDLPQGIRLIQSPTAWVLSNGLVRIAMAVRDAQNISSMMTLDVDPANNMQIVRDASQTSITPEFVTKMGFAGLGPCDAIWHQGQLWLYASQVTLKGAIYDASILLLTSEDEGKTFSRPQSILTSAANSDFPVIMPTVRQYSGSWHMWFTAFEAWQMDIKPRPDARYSIRYAQSEDGIVWTVQPGKAIALAGDCEAGMASPTASPKGRPEELWFSVRGPYDGDPSLRQYHLAYARVSEGENWQRADSLQSFANPPERGEWDCDMQCYPNVVELPDGRTCMFYCGNGYGAAGFGYAIRTEGNDVGREAAA